LFVDSSNRVATVLYSAPAVYKGGCLFVVAEFLKPVDGLMILRAWGGQSFAWENRNPLAAGVYSDHGFARDISLVGGWYDKVSNLASYYTNATLMVGTGNLAAVPELIVGSDRHESVFYSPDGQVLSVVAKLGVMTGLTAAKVGLPVKVDATWSYAATNAVGLTFGLTRATGIFKGSFNAWFDYGTVHSSKKIAFEGVMTPEREDPADGIEGRGFYLWSDKSSYTGATGNLVSYTYKPSYDFVIQNGR